MKLIDKQIKAVQESKQQCVREMLRDEEHGWNIEDCPLCIAFRDGHCMGCPVKIWAHELSGGCVVIIRDIFDDGNYSNSQDLACFLYSLELYLRERRNKHE